MSINNLNTYLNVRDAHLRVVSGNVYAQAMNIGGINVETAHGLQSVSDTGNVTSNTLQFSNATTGFVTTANVQIGRDLVVTGNATVSTDLTVSANATVTDTLTVSEHLLASKEATITGNLHVTTIRSDSNVVAEYTGPHDRPLRKYPEVALSVTSESASGEYGYKVAASKASTTFGTEYTVFDGLKGAAGANYMWRPYSYNGGTTQLYNTGTGLYDPTAITAAGEEVAQLDTNTEQGEWISVELPKAVKLKHFHIYSQWNSLNNLVDSGHLYAKNASTDSWVKIHSFSGATTTSVEVPTIHHVNSTTSYKYFALIVTKSAGGQPTIGEWELYGYEEGSGSLDTTLKSVYNVPATTGTQLEVYYDGQDYTQASDFIGSGGVIDKAGGDQDGTAGSGVSFDSTYKAFVFDGTSNGKIVGAHALNGTSPVLTMSFWVKRTAVVGNYDYVATIGTSTTGQMIGLTTNPSNQFNFGNFGDGVITQEPILLNQWYHVTLVANGEAAFNSTNFKMYINGKEPRLSSHGGGSTTTLTGTQLTLGTNTNSAEAFNGSIANFRLYSKALNADQVKELYDYQKDYFLGSKSQLTLYKGHLGVGVTEPSGQLELAGDERIQEYPPRALTGYSTYIEGHGVFEVENSSVANSSYRSFDAFDKDEDPLVNTAGWVSGLNTYDTGGTGLASGGSATDYFSIYGSGSWLKLKLPYAIKLKSSKFSIRAPSILEPLKSFTIYGSKDNTNWDALYSQSTSTPQSFSIDINSIEYYRCFVIHITEVDHNQGYAGIVEWRLFGTPGPTTLDKGSLTLGRSLDVPRVSRYDVDTETPRPEKLVVDFDTTVNNHASDISGQGNHMTFHGNASYSEADKAFVFDGTTGTYMSGTQNLGTGTPAHTITGWFKRTSTLTEYTWIFTIGTSATGQMSGLLIDPQGDIVFDIFNHRIETQKRINNNEWYHFAGVFNGASSTWSVDTCDVYINGVLEPTQSTGTSPQTFNLTGNQIYFGTSTNFLRYSSCLISNFKLYNVALEPSEVKKLYNLGRTGRSMVISDTAVGIGKVPEAQLDVRGSMGIAGYLGIGVNPGDSLGGTLHVATRHGDGLENASRRYFRYDTALTADTGGARGSIYGRWDIISSTYFISTAGTVSASDERIKKNIIDVNDSSALTTLRLLKPKRYQYRDTVERGTEPVWGFIAQEVRDTLPYATQLRTDYVPNIYQLATVSESNVITFSEFNTSELEDSKILKVISSNDEEHEVRITEIIDDTTIRVNTGLDGWTGSVDDEGNQIFVYGQKIDDFIFVKKDAIWTIATAALQEVDRQLQAERARNDALDARIETNIQELRAENTRLKNKVAILENRQTHFNTLLVNLTGRIETLERGA